MIKIAPILIEFGDGDTAFVTGLTEDGYGALELYNADSGELGREFDKPDDAIPAAYMIFKNLESIDLIIDALKLIRENMEIDQPVKESDVPVEEINNTKIFAVRSRTFCGRCRWGFNNECAKYDDCEGCPHAAHYGCKCGNIADKQPCPYFEEWEGTR